MRFINGFMPKPVEVAAPWQRPLSVGVARDAQTLQAFCTGFFGCPVIGCLLHLHLILSIMLHFCHCLTKMKIQCHKRGYVCVWCVLCCGVLHATQNVSPYGINRRQKLQPPAVGRERQRGKERHWDRQPRQTNYCCLRRPGNLPSSWQPHPGSLFPQQQVCAMKTFAVTFHLLLLLLLLLVLLLFVVVVLAAGSWALGLKMW